MKNFGLATAAAFGLVGIGVFVGSITEVTESWSASPVAIDSDGSQNDDTSSYPADSSYPVLSSWPGVSSDPCCTR